jgi:hypothetical protein
MGLTFGVHVFIGGPEIDAPVRASDLPDVVRATAHVVWHMVSLQLALIAAGLLWLARHANQALEITLAALQLGTAALFLWVDVTWFGALFTLPQWVVFVVVPVLTYLGQRRAQA